MRLSRRQLLALRFLSAASWASHEWASISAVLCMHGEKVVNGRVTADALVRKGLAVKTRDFPTYYRVSHDGMKYLKDKQRKGGEA